MAKLYNKIKQKVEDFIVEEITEVKPKDEGNYYLLELKKSNTSTLEALRVISRFLKIPLNQIGFAGLKDKFALTTQYLTIPKEFEVRETSFGIKNNKWTEKKVSLGKETGFTLKILGKTDRKLKIGDLKGNRFTITIRNFEKNLRERFYRNLDIVKTFGFPNYFGEQRFGSVKSRDNFVLRYILQGNFEGALRSYFFGKSNVEYFGDWRKLYKTLSPALEEYEKDLIRGLMRGLPPEKAFRILPKNVRLMFNFAFQSFLWNEYLREYIEKKYPFVQVPFINNWKLSYYLEVDDFEKLEKLEIPYTGHVHKPKDKVLGKAIKKVQKKYGIREEWFDKEVAGMVVMTDGLRKAIVKPSEFKILEKGKTHAKVRFSLPSGSYATVLLRFLIKG